MVAPLILQQQSFVALALIALIGGCQAFTSPLVRQPSRPTALHSSVDSTESVEPEPRLVDCLVIGSGVSGSCTAFNLVHNFGVDNVLVVERNEQVGGNLISVSNDDGFLWEEGPNSFQPTPAICRLVHELNMDDDLVLADGSLPRFVYWHGDGAAPRLADLHALPTNLPGDLLGFDLLTWPGKIRAGLGALGFIAPASKDDESIREFVTRHLGAETFERIIDPFVSGVYAGDPDQLSMKAALKKIFRLEGLGSLGPGLVSGAVARFQEIAQEKRDNPPDPAWPTYQGGQLGSFRRGLQTLAWRVQQYLTKAGGDRVWTSSPVNDPIQVDPATGRFQVMVSSLDGSASRKVLAKSVCVTSPTRVTCKIAADLVPAAAQLSKVYSPPVASVTMAYKKSSFRPLPGAASQKPLVGFGHLIPRRMGIRSLGTIWSSSLFPNRAPDDYELLLTYIGGARDPALADLSVDEIYAQVDADNHAILLKSDAPPGLRLGCRVWAQAIPQYNKGHLEILAALERDEVAVPGLFLGGNYRTGVAFGDCVQYGYQEAQRIAEFLKTSSSSTSTTEVPMPVKAMASV
jgi:protoporphyrinogen/coproporphyrinogen III oxidase